MPKPLDGCVVPAAGPLVEQSKTATAAEPVAEVKGGSKVSARVGKPAPDFEASAFTEGGFKNIKLSNFKGQWVVLCFYPGDFTFV